MALATMLARNYQSGVVFSDEVQHLFTTYQWPGNIRELDTSIRYAVLLSDGEPITLSHLPDRLLRNQTRDEIRVLQKLKDTTDIEQAVAQCNGNISAAARLLGIDRSTLYRRLRRKQQGKSQH